MPSRLESEQAAMRAMRELAERMDASNASDLHLQEGEPPILRIVAGLAPQTDMQPVDSAMLKILLDGFLGPAELEHLEKHGAVDAGVQLETMRVRMAAFRHRGGLAISFRRIPATPPVFSELHLPAVIKRFANLPRGLIILCGPTGCGKSTTAAALIHLINTSRRSHIITIEDPIEYVHKSRSSLVAQREIGHHTSSFADALREALREDPDVILVGEMRDVDTIALALRAAETGHLVFSTLHTSGAAGSISRIIDAFEPGARSTIRTQLSLVLMGVVSQLLLPTTDGKMRVPICEVMIPTDAVRHLIRENKLEQIPNIIQSGSTEGMLSFSAHIAELTKEGLIDTAGGLEAVGEAWRIADVVFEK
jgi:twitching motility protein PilT